VSNHESKLAQLRAELAAGPTDRAREEHLQPVRDREAQARPRVDLSLQRGSRSTPRARAWRPKAYPLRDLVAATPRAGFMPLRGAPAQSITLGGAAAGVGSRLSSLRAGADTLRARRPSRRRVDRHLSRTNEHRDLFYGFPNSTAPSLALKVTARTVP